MESRTFLVATIMVSVALAGCIGGNDFEPGTDYKPTGKTVHIRMWVEDMVRSDIFPGLQANLWAFCAEAADPNDEYSANAIEHREAQGVVERLLPDPDANGNPQFEFDADATSKCSVPGPQLRVQQGDKVIVDFVNDHFHPHTIHWHGQFVPWNSDGVPGSTQDSVVPQSSFTYEFEAKRAGTLWYHCHVDTQFHVMQGLYGVIIVEPQNKDLEPKGIDDEYTLVFSNLIRELVEPDPDQTDPHAKHRHGAVCGVSGIPGCKNPAITQDPDVFLLNGVSAPNTFMRNDTLIKIDPGEKIRIRMLNAGPFTVETIHLHGHDMLVTHIDGNPLPPEARYYVDTVLMGPGQRYDVVVEGVEGREGIWVMHTHITSRVTNSHQYPGGMITKLVYEDWIDEQGLQLTPYDGIESVGGLPYIKPYAIPDDVFVQDSVQTGLQPPGSTLATYTIPVELPCAVQKVDFRVRAIAPVEALLALNDVEVTITDDGGTSVPETTDQSLDDDGVFRYTIVDSYDDPANPETEGLNRYLVRDLPLEGPINITVTVTGSSPDLEIELTALVDYYRTKEHAQYYAKFSENINNPRLMCEEIMNPGLTGFYPPQNAPPL